MAIEDVGADVVWPPALLAYLWARVNRCACKTNCGCCITYIGRMTISHGEWKALSVRGILVGIIGATQTCKNRRCVRRSHHFAGRPYNPRRDAILGERLKILFDAETPEW